jgi:hypothetical protein
MSDQNKGPIYGVDLPAELPLGENGWTQAVPRRDELEQVRKKVGDRTVAALEIALRHCASMSQQLLESTKKITPSLLTCCWLGRDSTCLHVCTAVLTSSAFPTAWHAANHAQKRRVRNELRRTVPALQRGVRR